MNVVDRVAESVDTYLDTEVVILKRPLRSNDPFRCVGIFPLLNDVIAGSQEIGQREPTVERYSYRLQYLCKHVSEEEGRALYAVDTKIIKTILYRDPALWEALTQLSDEMLGYRERFQKFVVGSQRYLNNELNSQFMFLSVTEFYVETEVTPAT